MKKKLDNVWFGLIVGIVVPILFALLFLVSTYDGEYSISSLVRMMSTNSAIIKLLCVAIFPNMCGVFLLNTLEMWNACRGLFAAIGVYMIVCCVFLVINMV